jgi:hypothetical protein
MHMQQVMEVKRGEDGDDNGRISRASLSSHHRDNHSTIAFGTFPNFSSHSQFLTPPDYTLTSQPSHNHGRLHRVISYCRGAGNGGDIR